MAKGCSAALAVIWIATVAHALTTPVSMVLTPSTGGLGVQRLLPSLKNKVAPKASALWEKTTTKIETIRDRVTGKTERELQAEREALMEEVELLRESNAAVGRLQQKTAAELEATRAKADEEIALLKQNTLKELESTKQQAERRVETVRQAAANDLHEARREARSQVDAVRTQKEEEVRATRERAAAAALNARSLARSLTEKRLTKAQAESEALWDEFLGYSLHGQANSNQDELANPVFHKI